MPNLLSSKASTLVRFTPFLHQITFFSQDLWSLNKACSSFRHFFDQTDLGQFPETLPNFLQIAGAYEELVRHGKDKVDLGRVSREGFLRISNQMPFLPEKVPSSVDMELLNAANIDTLFEGCETSLWFTKGSICGNMFLF